MPIDHTYKFMLWLTASTTSTSNSLSNTHQHLFRCQFCKQFKSWKKINIITFKDGSQKKCMVHSSKNPTSCASVFVFPPAFQDIHLWFNGASVRTHQGRTLEFLWPCLEGDFLGPTVFNQLSSPMFLLGVRCFVCFLAFGWYFSIKLYII